MEHSLCCVGDLELYILFADNEVMMRLPEDCCTFSITPLIKELVADVSRLPPLHDIDGADGRLVQTMIDQFAKAPVKHLHLSMPTDPRLRTPLAFPWAT